MADEDDDSSSNVDVSELDDAPGWVNQYQSMGEPSIRWLEPVRFAVSYAISFDALVDAGTLDYGDRVLVLDPMDSAREGLYEWQQQQAPGYGALVRLEAQADRERGPVAVFVQEGTHAQVAFVRDTTDLNPRWHPLAAHGPAGPIDLLHPSPVLTDEPPMPDVELAATLWPPEAVARFIAVMQHRAGQDGEFGVAVDEALKDDDWEPPPEPPVFLEGDKADPKPRLGFLRDGDEREAFFLPSTFDSRMGQVPLPNHGTIRWDTTERRVSVGDVLELRVDGGRCIGVNINGVPLEDIEEDA